ncbi:MAG: hypothetical protein PHT69_11910 [Bacteroidales bacterium]|nr:hypothetical protein [Bacteroidales bacterium]
MNNINLPSDLISVIGNENIDFSVFAKRSEPIGKSIRLILFALLWSTIPVFGSIAFFGPLFKGEIVHFKSNGIARTASLDNFEPLIIPSLAIGFFLVMGFGMLTWGLLSFFKKGGYFVGTDSRLINYNRGNIKYYNWEQFTGNIELNVKKGNISLELKKKEMLNRAIRLNKFTPEYIHISGVDEILEIENICRKRIKENSESPADIN